MRDEDLAERLEAVERTVNDLAFRWKDDHRITVIMYAVLALAGVVGFWAYRHW